MIEIKVSPNNTKLGKIASFSLPSITSCPGATNECVSTCYAVKLERIYSNVDNAYQLNLQAIKDKNFVFSLSEEITRLTTKKTPIKTFRWHVSGDWSTIKYMYDCVSIMKKFPDITFYAYTRNWRLSNWLPHLDFLHALPNMTLFASIDDDTIKNNEWPPNHYKVAYFGENKDTVKTKYNLLPCPNQTTNKLCDSCKLCFNISYKENKKINILFRKH